MTTRITSIAAMRQWSQAQRRAGATIGLVPTMGAFHQGHLTLMRQAGLECARVVVSLFVNPTQFSPGEDFQTYPRRPEQDLTLAESVGVDVLFAPEAGEIYPPGFRSIVEVEGLGSGLCGAFRPGHFRGVATVVAKLFNIIQPDRAYFGEKDAQQLRIVRQMTRDLDFPLQVVAVPTVREDDGLAMSSRNVYLSTVERQAATCLYRALLAGRDRMLAGERDPDVIRVAMEQVLAREPLAHPQYVEVVDADTLEAPSGGGPWLLALAVLVGKSRLIDNLTVAGG